MSRLRQHLPFLSWIRPYDRAHLGGDISAGLTTAVMLVPQAMAYAMLAGLPPEVGLYASMLPLVIYALLGTSRQLAVGPVAMVSLLVASAITPLAVPGSAEYIGLALVLALLVGLVQAAMGFLRLGAIVSVLSHPVVSGFTSAAAIIIAMSQLGHLMGVRLDAGHQLHEVVVAAAGALGDVHLPTLAIGVGAVGIIVLMKRLVPRLPRALVVVVVGTLVVWALDLAARGVAVVGALDGGPPPLTLPPLDGHTLGALLPTAVAIALIAFMESVAVAKVLARRHGYRLDPNQELVGLGLANVGASFTGGFPVTGGFSRTAVNDQAGARTGLAALITAAMVLVTTLFLLPLFALLPTAVLAAIIVTAVAGLVDLREVRHLWKVKRSDLGFWAITFATTLFLGIEPGLVAGVLASLAWLVLQTTRPHTAVLGRIPGTRRYRNVANHPHAERDPGVVVLRMDARLYFGNVAHLEAAVETSVAMASTQEAPVHTVVLDASPMNDLDASGDMALDDLRERLARRPTRLLLAAVKHPVRCVMDRSGLAARLGPEAFCHDVHEAVERALALGAPAPAPDDPSAAPS